MANAMLVLCLCFATRFYSSTACLLASLLAAQLADYVSEA
jgi:hypothetical protein